MNNLSDKALLLMCCMLVYYFFVDIKQADLVTPFLLSITYGSFSSFFDKNIFRMFIFLSYLIICFFWPNYLLILPFMIYDVAFTGYQYLSFAVFLILGMNLEKYTVNEVLIFFLINAFSFYLKKRANQIHRLEKELAVSKDTSMELLLVQEEKNRSLLENQDYEVNLAMLNERNRISKEIHDNVGHLLSRTLIQIGALLTISKEPVVRQELEKMKVSVSEGMTAVRASIHNMHDDSVDLYTALLKLVREFTFCEINFEYDIKVNPVLKIRYCIIAAVTEALGNVMKHSNATHVDLLVTELPKHYKLMIADNGTVDEKVQKKLRENAELQGNFEGMGLHNIKDRISGFQGSIDITGEDGFRIYLTIPKNKEE